MKWNLRPVPNGLTETIIIAGDWAPLETHRTVLFTNPAGFYGDLLPVLREADLRIVNVETVLGDLGKPIPKDGPNLRAPESYIASLTAVPFDIACLANNHTGDFGMEGLTETITILQKNGLRTTGAHTDQKQVYSPLFLDLKHCRVGILNVAEGEEAKATTGNGGAAGITSDLIGVVSALKSQVDVCLVIVHAGREFLPTPPPYLYTLFHQIAEAGADAVIGHHPHVPQGIEIYHQKILAYSLGNFAFYWGPNGYYEHLGYLVRLEINAEGIIEAGIAPYRIEPAGLRLLNAGELLEFSSALKKAAAPLENLAGVTEVWEAFADQWGRQMIPGGLGEIVTLYQENPIKAAGILYNYFDTTAHRELFLTYLGRVKSNVSGSAPQWANELVKEWRR